MLNLRRYAWGNDRPRICRGLFASAMFFVSIHLIGVALAESRPECIKNSNERRGTFISSAPCGAYGSVVSRQKVGEDVLVQYMIHTPNRSPKGLVVLFAGGNGNTGIVGDPNTGDVLSAGNNFLVRSAQLFAKHRYLAVTIDRPLVGPGQTPEFSTNQEYDQYRVSADHGIDIAAVVTAVNVDDLPVFLAGTSRGAISAVAQHRLGLGIIGILLSSPVTSQGGNPANLFVGHPDATTYPNLQPGFVIVPAHVLAHELDACVVSTPADSEALHNKFVNLVIDSKLNQVTGGFDLTDNVTITACDAKTHHGFLGIENKAVEKITKRMNKILNASN